MEVTSIRQFHQLMESNKLIMLYEGEFTQEITKGVLAMTERNLDKDSVEAGIKKKIYNVMVEVLQNICKHQASSSDDAKTAVFMIGEDEEHFFVISGNTIQQNKIAAIEEKLNLINSKDKDGLKLLFRDLRLSATISEAGGAGLGFVDIARKSESKLKFQFDLIKDDLYYFIFLSTISKHTSENN